MKFYFPLITLILAIVSCKSTPIAAQKMVPSFSIAKKTTHKIKKGQDYTFGYLKVMENRQDPNSSTIEVPVYIFKSRSKNPPKDPIIYTVGGPGSTTMPSAQYMQYYKYLDDRDFILIKQCFFDYLTEKTQAPLEVSIENPKNSKTETFYLEGADLVTVFSSASTGDVVDIPFELNKLLMGDMSTVKEQLSYLFQKPGNGAGLGMRLSVWCAEENPFNSQSTIAIETEKYPQFKGLSPAVFDNEICNIWSVKSVSEIENQSVISDIPVLLISGEYDNETPVKWAKSMMSNLSNSYHLIFTAWKHTPTTNWGNPCAMQAANDFFNDPNDAPTPDCYKQIESPKFKTE